MEADREITKALEMKTETELVPFPAPTVTDCVRPWASHPQQSVTGFVSLALLPFSN